MTHDAFSFGAEVVDVIAIICKGEGDEWTAGNGTSSTHDYDIFIKVRKALVVLLCALWCSKPSPTLILQKDLQPRLSC